MKRRGSKSAADFMQELGEDPEYMKRRAERDEAQAHRRTEISRSLEGVMEEARRAGYAVTEIDELPKTYAPLPAGLVDVLLRGLRSIGNEGAQESVVRVLAAAGVPYDGTILARLFESTDSSSLRWAIANTFAVTSPTGVNEWLVGVLSNHSYGSARQMIPVAIARTHSPEAANEILVRFIRELPGHVAMALAATGGQRELELLRQSLDRAKGWERRAIGRACGAIERRLQSR